MDPDLVADLPVSTTAKKIAVIGGGSFGTAIANLIAENGHLACLWLRNAQRADEINTLHVNSAYLPQLTLHPNMSASSSIEEAVDGCEIVYMAVPSRSCREVARVLAPHLRKGTLVISTTKGIEAQSYKLMSQVLTEELPGARLGVLSGPNLAGEIADRQLTGTVIASDDAELKKTIQAVMHCSYFRVYSGSDMYGVELGGALKNIYAIIAGIAAALHLGQNTIGLLLTRGLAEMSRFAVELGANPLTFIGLAGVGDLIVTCMSPLSRNYRVGFALGEGKDLQEIVNELGQVAEGVNTLKLVKERADELGIDMPLVENLYRVIYEGLSITEAVGSMMSREQNRDVEFVIEHE
jgi:glycerol-3-phosphate dehydrogenase (NAD(P)+)